MGNWADKALLLSVFVGVEGIIFLLTFLLPTKFWNWKKDTWKKILAVSLGGMAFFVLFFKTAPFLLSYLFVMFLKIVF